MVYDARIQLFHRESTDIFVILTPTLIITVKTFHGDISDIFMFIFNPSPRHMLQQTGHSKGHTLKPCIAWPGLMVGQFRYQPFLISPRLSYTLGSDLSLKLSFNISHGLI